MITPNRKSRSRASATLVAGSLAAGLLSIAAPAGAVDVVQTCNAANIVQVGNAAGDLREVAGDGFGAG